VVIFAGVKGYLDKIKVNQVAAFEEGLLGLLHSKHGEILSAIEKEKAISDDVEEKLKSVLEGFVKTFTG